MDKLEELKYVEKTSTVFCYTTITIWVVSILGLLASIIFTNFYICLGAGTLFVFIGIPCYAIFRNWMEKEITLRREINAIEATKNS